MEVKLRELCIYKLPVVSWQGVLEYIDLVNRCIVLAGVIAFIPLSIFYEGRSVLKII